VLVKFWYEEGQRLRWGGGLDLYAQDMAEKLAWGGMALRATSLRMVVLGRVPMNVTWNRRTASANENRATSIAYELPVYGILCSFNEFFHVSNLVSFTLE
jgi:hypothetical protein